MRTLLALGKAKAFLSPASLEPAENAEKGKRASLGEIMREAVDNVIRSSAGVAAGAEDRRGRALNAVGKFSSVKRAISRKHDQYLSEAFRK